MPKERAWVHEVLIRTGLPAVCLLTFISAACGPAEEPGDRHTQALLSWNQISTVLLHPRCLNCHQVEMPLQGDLRRVHIPRVVRGPDSLGVSAMRCGNCHNETGNNPTSGVPGAPHWSLAPVEMSWEGLSVGELCRAVKDPERNGNRTVEALLKHMDSDPLVLWGWSPGKDREPVPMDHAVFVEHLRVWSEGGAPCPE